MSVGRFECDRFPPRHCEIVRRRGFREEDVPDYDRSDEVERAMADERRGRTERNYLALGELRRAGARA